jgi:hypothetical protein
LAARVKISSFSCATAVQNCAEVAHKKMHIYFFSPARGYAAGGASSAIAI